jgi:hypothetical protein
MNFQEFVKKFEDYKLKETGKRGASKQELKSLREKWSAKVVEVRSKKKLNETLSNFRQYKAKKGLGNKVEYDEFKKLREAVKQEVLNELKERTAPKAGQFNKLVENYGKYKQTVTKNPDAKVTYKEVKSLREAFIKTKGRLREADAGFDPTAGMAGGDPNAAPVDPMAAGGVTVDPTIAAQIQDVKASIDALAQAAGIQTDDMGADPNAGVPPVDGMGADGMGAQAPQAAPPMRTDKLQETVGNFVLYTREKYKREPSQDEIKKLVEKLGVKLSAPKPKSKLQQIKERIEAREAALNSAQGKEKLNENAAQDLGKKVLAGLPPPFGQASWEPDKSSGSSKKPDGSASEELVVVPAASSLAKGYASGAAEKPGARWPTKSPKDLGALQGAGASQKRAEKLQEEETDDDENKDDPKCDEKLQESKLQEKSEVQSVTQLYVDNYLNTPKLSFESLKTSLATGILG